MEHLNQDEQTLTVLCAFAEVGSRYRSAAVNCYQLKKHGITHVLNTAEGPDDDFHCNITPRHYTKPGQ